MDATADTDAIVPADDGPLRTCVVTRGQHPVADLVRFVQGPDGAIVPDLAGRLPGRGVWVCCDAQSVTTAVKTRAFNKSLKREAQAAADLPDLVERLLLKRACNLLSIANKAGLVVAGNAKVDAAIANGLPLALLHGADCAADGVDKLDRRFHAMCRDSGREPRIVRNLTIEQLSLALGRSNVVHAALMMGGAADLFLSEAERHRRFTTGKPAT